MRLVFMTAIAAALLSGQALAEPVPAAAAPDTLAGVTVTAPLLKPALQRGVDDYVRSLAGSQYGETLTRWRDPICPLVAGLAPQQAAFIIVRLREVAREVAAPVAKGACRTNLYVVATPDPKGLITPWWRRRPGLFGRARPAVAKRIIDSPGAVRVWHDTEMAAASGAPVSQDPNEYNGAPVLGGGFVTDSRIVDNAERNTYQVVVVIEAAKLSRVKVAQLADFIAMAALTEVDFANAPAAAPSILHLFDATGAVPPAGLSAWDLAHLKAVYQVPQDDRMEQQVVSRRVVEALGP